MRFYRGDSPRVVSPSGESPQTLSYNIVQVDVRFLEGHKTSHPHLGTTRVAKNPTLQWLSSLDRVCLR